ncbi:MAG: VOC family protein [Chloroflexi bacterium]|nr:VOC family protein [Chloroflexota bacterium]MBT4073116.1 VOC family protein [Chloroflexota bacterium]MBT4515112.1 VOC family protein [Chloroflexota bacterium]MBT5319358.1 VOC family protein [Chloroflexota bacterium]MBT6682831.1 VOC family protein [Chloroflexota bacterium]
MAFEINHIHLKAPDPRRTAEWYVEAFGFEIVSDTVRSVGDRRLNCMSPGGLVVNISSERDGETMADGDAGSHWGLEHFGVNSDDLLADIERLGALGAPVLEGPIDIPGGNLVAFVQGPDDVRIEVVQNR